KTLRYSVVGYGCTSASSIIGSDQVEKLVQKTCDVETVTNPLRAATAYAAHKGISKLAMLSPYIGEVNIPMRAAFSKAGISTDVFGTFGEAEEAKVARISTDSVVEAAARLGADDSVEGVFLSCTNLKTFDAIPKISELIGKPVFSSNSSLAWHMKTCVGR
ncbi:MAG: Asp/Glu racemase, partial [Paracoccaceae bacterium]|nr:Asp/Glu racemase [Paracoccaceae bacterium]